MVLLQLLVSSALVFASQAVFQKKQIKIGSHKIIVEIAETEEQRSQGLMFRKELSSGSGMLFIFEEERPRSFWMKNTFVPLSIGYFDKNRKLLETYDMEPVVSEMDINPKVYPSKKKAQYALEVPMGWFKKNKIKIGTKFDFIK